MTNLAFREVLAAGDDARRDLFLTASERLGTAVQNVEKDFWVCWVLGALFNELPAGHPRLLFKGGTSLSKSFGLINRFSEDIDITVFRHDLGQDASVEELEALSGKKRRARLDAIKEACQTFVGGSFRRDLEERAVELMAAGAIPPDRYRVELDVHDADQQTLLFWYPVVATAGDGYVRSAVKIEAGAKSALDPNVETSVRPYVADDLPDLDLTVGGITTVDAQRTFWDRSSSSTDSVAGTTTAGSFAMAASAYPATTTTSSSSCSRRSARPPRPIANSERTALATLGCSSTVPTSISMTPSRGRSPFHHRRPCESFLKGTTTR